ncbi:hypothetical protein [Streptomyces sp. 891-h]|uniref:hypothetical protein n=1 Tax=Streptomyces sp. 891-h TaxID=2720714 RepID=UPI001FAA7B55|nr:hypothetical protein [Streptomyces sp. 891-h]UNZ20604.1 hypothetical protein HC362_29610 [Streptomyces sp. 891-h]
MSGVLEQAAALEASWYTGRRAWFGSSGELVPARRLADGLAQASATFRRDGWMPGEFGLWEVLDGDRDVRMVARQVLELLICARTGASAADPILWDLVPGRTIEQVLNLLAEGEAYARHYGPAVVEAGDR